MTREQSNFIDYTVALVSEFAAHFGIRQKQAANYLLRFKGLQHLEQCYNVLHTFSFDDAVYALTMVCKKNGGKLG